MASELDEYVVLEEEEEEYVPPSLTVLFNMWITVGWLDYLLDDG